jgi:two-component system sensor histidine kinase DegS
MPALQFLVEDFLTRTNIACELIEEGVKDQLPDTAKTCVYRVVQEALHNCEKHSGAANVRVEVKQSEGALTATIADDGRGFAPSGAAAPRAGMRLGLMGMRERAAIAHGILAVDSAPGQGTRVLLQIPIPVSIESPTHKATEVSV